MVLFIIIVVLSLLLVVDMGGFNSSEPQISRFTRMSFNTLGYRIGGDDFESDWQWVQGKRAPFVVLMPKGFQYRRCRLKPEEAEGVEDCFEYTLENEYQGRFYVTAMRKAENDLFVAYEEELKTLVKEDQLKLEIDGEVVEWQRGLITQSVPYCRTLDNDQCPGRVKLFHTPEWIISIMVKPSEAMLTTYPDLLSYYDSFFLNGIQFCKLFANPSVKGRLCRAS